MAGRKSYLILPRHHLPKPLTCWSLKSANVLWKSVRAGLIEKDTVHELYSSMELLFTKGPLILKPASLFMGKALSIAISLDTPVYDALFIAKAHCHTGYCGSSPGFFCAKKYGVTTILV